MLTFLKNPNLDIGIFLFYLFFIIIIPILLFMHTNYLKFYMPLMIPLANMLTNSLSPLLFKKLYDLKSDDILTIISTHFIILYSFIGLLWLTITYSQTGVKLHTSIIYGIFLYILIYILSNEPMILLVNKLASKLDGNIDNWARLIIGTIYVVIISLSVLFVSKLTNITDNKINLKYLGKKYSSNNISKDVSLTSINNLFK